MLDEQKQTIVDIIVTIINSYCISKDDAKKVASEIAGQVNVDGVK